MRETRVQPLGQEDTLAKEMATHSSILVWRIPWTEEPGRLQSMGSQRVGHDWVTNTAVHLVHWWMLYGTKRRNRAYRRLLQPFPNEGGEGWSWGKARTTYHNLFAGLWSPEAQAEGKSSEEKNIVSHPPILEMEIAGMGRDRNGVADCFICSSLALILYSSEFLRAAMQRVAYFIFWC